MAEKKVVFIIGRLDVPNYWEPFEKAEDDLTAEDFIPLSPSRLPYNLPADKRMKLQVAMIDTADAVLLIPGWHFSATAQVLLAYAKATGKVIVELDGAKEVHV